MANEAHAVELLPVVALLGADSDTDMYRLNNFKELDG